MLHFKDGTDGLTLQDYKAVFDAKMFGAYPNVNLDQGILDYLFSTADACEDIDDGKS